MNTSTTAFVSLLVLAGCGGGAGDARASHDGATGGGETSATSTRVARPTHPALAPLQPPGSDAVDEGLTRAPRRADAYAESARFYAETDAAGMALLYGLAHVALGGDDGAVSDAMARVLRERITVTGDTTRRHVSTRLAPGSMPAFASDDGSMRAPVAHVFELALVPALATFLGEWTMPVVVAMLDGYVQRGHSLLDEAVELNGWLGQLAEAGHLPGFAALAFGPGLGLEIGEDAAAAREWIETHPFAPTRAFFPDDLVRVQ